MKKIVTMLILMLVLTSCIPNTSGGGFGSYFGCTRKSGISGFTPGFDSGFGVNNNAVFDLFQDDFGTGTVYGEKFKAGSNKDVGVSATTVSADGQIDYQMGQSYTFDPKYDEIGKLTPQELHPQQSIDIPVLTLGGNLYPFPDKQFGDMAEADLCDHKHYHGHSGYTLDRKIISQPENPCGFDNATKIISVTGDEMIEWYHNRPRNF